MFTVALSALGYKAREFIPSFVVLYLISVLIFTLGQWDKANTYNLEPPLVALVVGLALSNVFGLPRWLDAGFRVEFYIKTGIVLLGATLPFTLIVWAGPVAILQASIISVITFLVIYYAGVKLGLDRRLAATLGAGGAVCGVSAAIAIAGAVGAKKDDAPIAITVVIVWAIAMIFVLPFAAQALHLHAGVGGAWIGTSEFADAAGFAAAQTYGDLASHGDRCRHQRSGGVRLHADESRRPRRLDRHLGLRARDRRHHPAGSAPRPGTDRRRRRSGGAFRNSSSASWSPR